VPPVTGLGGTSRGSVGASGAGPRRLTTSIGDGIRDASRLAVLDDARRCGVAGSSDGADQIRSGDKT